MLDRTVHGEVHRISPEAPVPVLRVRRSEEALGGAGNVARNVSALGSQVTLIGAVGEDAEAASVRRLISTLPGVVDAVRAWPGRSTTTKTRFIASAQQMLRADQEECGPPDALQGAEIVAATRAALGEADVLILSDYAKGVLDASVCAQVITAARESGVPVIVDPKGACYEGYRGADVVAPNLAELAEVTRLPVGTDEEVVRAAQSLREAYGIGVVVATRSEAGMSVVGSSVLHLRAEAREVFDVAGAGDTVVAMLALALARGLPVSRAGWLANLAAGIVVGKVGTAVATSEEVARRERESIAGPERAALCSLAEAQAKVAAWRERGLSVGFTNGCFDLLHPGHVALLTRARASCNRLIVGLNGDASVKRLKGARRPIQTEQDRAALLCALSAVDAVIIFEGDTPLELIEALRPDVLVKGADYSLDAVVGAECVRSHGGRVELVRLVPGQHTSATIRHITRSARRGVDGTAAE